MICFWVFLSRWSLSTCYCFEGWFPSSSLTSHLPLLSASLRGLSVCEHLSIYFASFKLSSCLLLFCLSLQIFNTMFITTCRTLFHVQRWQNFEEQLNFAHKATKHDIKYNHTHNRGELEHDSAEEWKSARMRTYYFAVITTSVTLQTYIKFWPWHHKNLAEPHIKILPASCLTLQHGLHPERQSCRNLFAKCLGTVWLPRSWTPQNLKRDWCVIDQFCLCTLTLKSSHLIFEILLSPSLTGLQLWPMHKSWPDLSQDKNFANHRFTLS